MLRKRRIWIISLFAEYFDAYLQRGVVGQALRGERGLNFSFKVVNPADYSPKNWKGVDNGPYGGGAGMVLRADVLKNTLMDGIVASGLYGADFSTKLHIVYTSPRGNIWNNSYAHDFANRIWGGSAEQDLVIICGRYEGIDERFIEKYVNEEISLGDYVLTGGEIAALAMLDSALRFVPGVLGNSESAMHESFGEGLLEHPHYTRPRDFEGLQVPDVLLEGNHAEIESYRYGERERVTKQYRPDLWERYCKKKTEGN